jgi:hypothetical protein
LKILSAIQEIIINKSINDIVYQDDLVFKRYKSDLYKKLNINYWSAIPSPPLNNSKETTEEIKQILKLTQNRSDSDRNLVFTVDKDPLLLFSGIIQEYDLIFPYQEFNNLYTFLYTIVKDLKYFYNRARPYQLADFYHTPINVIRTETHHTPSYPSGHTAYAALATKLLTEKYPEHRIHFQEILDSCAKARVLQGIHYSSDNMASIILVDKVYKQLSEFNRNF